LRLVRHASHNQLSLLGLNLGRLGFLADLNLSNLTPLLDILNGNYYLEQRDLIAVYAGTKTTDEHYLGSALNDVLVKSDKPGKNIDLKVSIDSKHHFTHHADGFLFSTPTGSTAYALSAGGPVIYPTLPVHLLLPICSHRLNSRPLVLANTSETQLTLGTLVNRTASICIDGRPCGQLKSNMCITIKRAAEKLSLIHSKHYDFLAVAQQKIQWEST
jgi:NAD+ kinase